MQVNTNVVRYALGFLFDAEAQHVLLIKKRAGLLQGWNGIGGSVHDDETPADAMAREANEEAGIGAANWREFAKLTFPQEPQHARAECYCYVARGNHALKAAYTRTDEPIAVWPVAQLPVYALQNVPALVLLARAYIETSKGYLEAKCI